MNSVTVFVLTVALAASAGPFIVWLVVCLLQRQAKQVQCAICGQRMPIKAARRIDPMTLHGFAPCLRPYYIHSGPWCPSRR